MSINALEQLGYRKLILRHPTMILMMDLVIQFPFQVIHWQLGQGLRIATKQQSLMVIAPAVITVILLPELFMSINALEQLGYRKRTSRQSTMMLLMDLVIQFHY